MRTSLYRFYSEANELLYIGIARDPFARSGQHQAAKDMTLVRHIEIEWFPDRASAAKAERWAILRENPKWNKARPEKPRQFAVTELTGTAGAVVVEKPVNPHPWRHFALGLVDGVTHNLTFCVTQDGASRALRALRRGDFLHLSKETPNLPDGFAADLEFNGIRIVWIDGPYIPSFGLSALGHKIGTETAKLEAMLAGMTPQQRQAQINAWSNPLDQGAQEALRLADLPLPRNLPKPKKRKAK